MKSLGTARIAALSAFLTAAVVLTVYLAFKIGSVQMRPLFTQLDPLDATRITEKLKNSQVDFEVSADGTQIFVADGETARLRMELAREGLPASGGAGYELFEQGDMLAGTGALADINYVRALEGELARSIRTIQGIQSVRVHLAIPKKELFSRDKPQPSASVVVRLKGGSSLSGEQVQSIRYLTATAVQGLTTERVCIVDDRGAVLAKSDEGIGDNVSRSFTMQQDMRNQMENKIARSVESLLDRSLGAGKSRVEVNLDLDFDQVSSTSVIYDPEGQVIRSTNTSEEGSDTQESETADAVSVANAVSSAAGEKGGQQAKSHAVNSENSTNYEISTTTKNFVAETGKVRRMSVAVMVDGEMKKNAEDKEEYTPRSEDDLQKLTELVKTATGFREDRGDVIQVMNLPFADTSVEPAAGGEMYDSFLNRIKVNPAYLLQMLVIGLIAMAGLTMVIRPVIRMLLNIREQNGTDGLSAASEPYTPGMQAYINPNGSAAYLAGTAADAYSGTAQEQGGGEAGTDPAGSVRSEPDTLHQVSDMIVRNPDQAIALLRDWMYRTAG